MTVEMCHHTTEESFRTAEAETVDVQLEQAIVILAIRIE